MLQLLKRYWWVFDLRGALAIGSSDMIIGTSIIALPSMYRSETPGFSPESIKKCLFSAETLIKYRSTDVWSRKKETKIKEAF